MIPAQFDYVRPAAMHEALQILVDREGDAKILSGGYSLLPLLKLRLAAPALLVDIRDIDGLDDIVETTDGLRIGGRATHRQIHENPVVAGYPMLVDAAGGIGDPQVRNWGTIGGSCAHADPSSDWPAVLLATNATIVLQSAAGTRTVPARGFFVDTFQTAIEPTELLTEVIIPRAPRPSGAAYAKLERRAGDFATVGVAAQISLGAGRAGTGRSNLPGGRDRRRRRVAAGYRLAWAGRIQASHGQGNGRPGAAHRGRPRAGAAVGAKR